MLGHRLQRLANILPISGQRTEEYVIESIALALIKLMPPGHYK